ncbi:MAG: hypothetical protein Q8R00_03835 [Candidatus Nanoarchaeia archaeon]|nr:hypothetical protein [Candidatus Nanoarchaeia archaeon]
MVGPGGCVDGTMVEGGRYIHLAGVFNKLERDLICLIDGVGPRLNENSRRMIYATVIKHLRLLHPYEKLLKPKNGSEFMRYARALDYHNTRKDYGERDEAFFKKYAPPNDVLRELAKISRRDLNEVNKSQLVSFRELAEFHSDHYLHKSAELRAL